jgi:UPF0716 family protein affecting phage T7 exclusion
MNLIRHPGLNLKQAALVSQFALAIAPSAARGGKMLHERRLDGRIAVFRAVANPICLIPGLITNIAGRTALLAPTPANEAARPSDAGKGLASLYPTATR